MSTNPGPDDARQPSRSFSDAAALFQPIIPVAGTPLVVHEPVAPLVEQELPPATGPQPIPDAPRVPPVMARAEPVAFQPAPMAWERREKPVVEDVAVQPTAFEAPPHEPEPEPQDDAPAPPQPQARRRWWSVVAIPVLLAAIAGLAWLQPTPRQTQSSDAIQGATGQAPAVAPNSSAAPPAPAPPIPVPASPAAPATGAAAPNRTPPVSTAVPSAPAAAVAPVAQPGPTSPEPAVTPSPPTPPRPPVVEAVPQPAAPGTTPDGSPLVFPVVAIRMRAGSAAAQAEASRISALLMTSATRLDVQTVPTGLRAPTIRYFRAEDAASARALAAALPRNGTPWQVRSMRAPRNPIPGLLEVWVPAN